MSTCIYAELRVLYMTSEILRNIQSRIESGDHVHRFRFSGDSVPFVNTKVCLSFYDDVEMSVSVLNQNLGQSDINRIFVSAFGIFGSFGAHTIAPPRRS
jgi:hypothetical protein